MMANKKAAFCGLYPSSIDSDTNKSSRVWLDHAEGLPFSKFSVRALVFVFGRSVQNLHPEIVQHILLDMPSLAFFTTYALLILFWAEIYYQVCHCLRHLAFYCMVEDMPFNFTGLLCFTSFHHMTTSEHRVSHVMPMLVRAYDDGDPRIQEEALRKSLFLAKQLDMQLVKEAILPRIHGLALKTTVAAAWMMKMILLPR
ncbi:hypothetical protein ES288_D11G378000v1 [Gossypium darwinii]|uniref:THH1/TOM1/TOM3 domain-containing protein n=1 Tax=Gossypium darwinii TaxID=34276 RepID=A0A5D2AVG5_GOSDA|nr:hypothetical protein ES288_D11G378000v1 [Gossypium darwinii]